MKLLRSLTTLLVVIALVSCNNTEGPSVTIAGKNIMKSSDFGITTNLRSWDSTAQVVSVSDAVAIDESYEMITGKRRLCKNTGTERIYTLKNAAGDNLQLVFRQYTDGIAFRYVLDNAKAGEVVTSYNTRFNIPADAKRWMQKYNGGYENFFPVCEGGISPEGKKITEWGYPALIELDSANYMLISDSYSPATYNGTLLKNDTLNRNTYSVSMFGADTIANGKWQSAWQVIITGSLADIVESTLVNDVAEPCKLDDTSWIEPGLSSWIYWAYNHGSQEYDILKQYVDFAAEIKWPYTLVDAEWDVMRGGNIEQLVKYSVSKGIKPIIWYNSGTNWAGPGSYAPTPWFRLNDPKDRDNEFATISEWGVKGVKIDFFRTDNAETIKYYRDLLLAAAKYKMLVNFHGGTIPHGWQRTYPNVITYEGVYGAEWYNNLPILTNRAAAHNATLPFTRNVIGSMDYTPGTFTDSQHPHITTHAHELALPILFESGIQHMPDRPDAYRQLPKKVWDLLSTLPTTWDDTRFLAGYPGQAVVIARQKGNTWYIAGINGTDEEQTISFSLDKLNNRAQNGTLFADGETQTSFAISDFSANNTEVSIACKPRGGFVIKL